MLHEEVEKYINLSGDKEAWQNTSVSRIGGYLDGYDKGLEVLDKIRAEFVSLYPKNYVGEPELGGLSCVFSLDKVLEILDKHKAQKARNHEQVQI